MQVRNVASCLLRILTSGWNIHGFNIGFFFLNPLIQSTDEWKHKTKSIFFFFWRPRNEYDYGPLGAWEMQRKKYFTCRLPWTEGLTKIKINVQTWSKMREVEQFQTKMLVETRIGRICANCHSVSSVAAQVFEQGGGKIAGLVGANMPDCWLDEPSFYCRQFAGYHENLTCRAKRVPLHWLTRYDNILTT